MRNAIIISLAVHVVLGFVAMRLVRISQVRFVPREVYAVRLVSLQEAAKPQKQPMSPPPQEAPKEPPKKVEEPKKEELVTPTKKPKPERKPPAPKTVPSTQIDQPAAEQSSEEPDTGPVSTGDMSLDVEDFPFAYYLSTVKRKIAANWQVPATSRQALSSRVYFRIRKSGAIESPAIEASSGNFLFDQAALRAVVQASPLPPLPGGFGDEYLGVHFSFAYEEE